MGRIGIDVRLVGTEHLGWRRAARLIRQLAQDPTTATYRAYGAETARWTAEVQLLAEAVNYQRLLLWSKTADGQKNRNRPPMILPPWEREEPKVLGKARMTIAQAREWLGWDKRS